MSFFRSLKTGVGCLTVGIGQILLSCLSIGIHLFTIFIVFSIGGIFFGILTIFFPLLSEIIWFIVLWAKFGFFNIFTYAILGYVVIMLVTIGGMHLVYSGSKDM